VGAVVLLSAGLAGLAATWNAARPLIDPTRRYSPSWLPAMVIAAWLRRTVLGVGSDA